MAAVAGASPVTMTVRTPSPSNSLISAAESLRGGSAKRDESRELHRRRRPGGDRQHPETLVLEFLGSGGCSRRRLGNADNDGVGALHDSLWISCRICCGRLGHLLGRVERREFDQLRRVQDRVARGRCAYGAIDRILAAIRAGERGQHQNVCLVESRMGRTVVTVSAFWGACRSCQRRGQPSMPLHPRPRGVSEGHPVLPGPARQGRTRG